MLGEAVKEFKLNHPVLENEEVMLSVSDLFGKPELSHNGCKLLEDVAQGKNCYTLKKENGEAILLMLRPRPLEAFPKIEIEGKKCRFGPKLKLLDYIIIGLPLSLIYAGGVIGIVLGILATSLNARILNRLSKHGYKRYIFCLLSFLGATFIWFISALLL